MQYQSAKCVSLQLMRYVKYIELISTFIVGQPSQSNIAFVQRIQTNKKNEIAIYSEETVANSKRDSEERTQECLVAADR